MQPDSTRSHRRHLIIEGMDGSGKDTLIHHLIKTISHPGTPLGTQFPQPHFRVHARASTSLGGPVDELDQWVENDLALMALARPWIYNRHPLISEPIYAPYRQINPGSKGKFRDPNWIKAKSVMVARQSFLVVCDPGWDHIKKTLRENHGAHMPGVVENAENLYAQYINVGYNWPGPVLRYNYMEAAPSFVAQRLHTMLEWGPFRG